MAKELAARQQITHQEVEEIDGDQLDRGPASLGGLVIVDEQQRYSLFHLKFREYLRQDTQRPLFDTGDEQRWHKRFVAWCERDSLERIWEESANAVEQGRCRYAHQHYITHLSSAGE